jgi:uncharacterized membrane protein
MERLAQVNRTVLFLIAAGYVFAALIIPGIVGAAMLLALAAALGWLQVRTWPAHAGRTRGVRVLILAFMIVIAVVKLTR